MCAVHLRLHFGYEDTFHQTQVPCLDASKRNTVREENKREKDLLFYCSEFWFQKQKIEISNHNFKLRIDILERWVESTMTWKSNLCWLECHYHVVSWDLCDKYHNFHLNICITVLIGLGRVLELCLCSSPNKSTYLWDTSCTVKEKGKTNINTTTVSHEIPLWI